MSPAAKVLHRPGGSDLGQSHGLHLQRQTGRGTGLGAVDEDARALAGARFQSGLEVDSESDALSQASSSPQSLMEYEENLF